MKRIAFVLGGMGIGGAERVISILSKHYAKKGYQTDILLLLNNKVEYSLDESTKIIDSSGNTNSRLKRVFYWIKSIREYVKSNKPDVVVSFVARVNILTFFALRNSKVFHVVSERNDPKRDKRGLIVKILTKLLYKKADKVIFQSAKARSYFKRLKNAVIIPNPVEVSELASATNPNKIVNVARLSKQKNQKLLIDAFKEVSISHPSAFLEIYGEGNEEKKILKQIEKLNLTNKVFLKGVEKNIHESIKDSAIFCLTSNYEGLSNAMLEAMMMGIPCVSTNCLGAEDYIEDGKNGYIVSLNDKNSLVARINELLTDTKKREQFSINARKSVDCCRLENVMVLWDSVILGE